MTFGFSTAYFRVKPDIRFPTLAGYIFFAQILRLLNFGIQAGGRFSKSEKKPKKVRIPELLAMPAW